MSTLVREFESGRHIILDKRLPMNVLCIVGRVANAATTAVNSCDEGRLG